MCGAPANITDVLYGNVSGAALEDVLPSFKDAYSYLAVRTATGDQWELGRCRSALRVKPTTDFNYEFDGDKTTISCGQKFVFDHSQVQQNIVTDWNLVCDGEWLAKLCQPTFMIGVMIGALVFGDVADR